MSLSAVSIPSRLLTTSFWSRRHRQDAVRNRARTLPGGAGRGRWHRLRPASAGPRRCSHRPADRGSPRSLGGDPCGYRDSTGAEADARRPRQPRAALAGRGCANRRPARDRLSALRLVATSREPLRIAGETELDLPPMGERDAVSLFLERAQAIRADIGHSPAVHELVQRLDHLPLAIELAAARVKLLRPEQLLERIALSVSTSSRAGAMQTSGTRPCGTTISWSYDPPPRRRARALCPSGDLPRGCANRSEDAEQVCDADLDTLASLLRHRQVVRRRTDTDGEERFWMLEMIREFARQRLDESGEEDALRAAQANRLIALATRAGTTAVIDEPMPWDFDLIAPEDRQRQ